MARPKTKIAKEDSEIDELVGTDDFISFLEDIGPNSNFVEVYRVPKTGGDIEWLEIVPFEQFQEGGLQYLKETHGPGKFRLSFKDTNKKYLAQKTVTIGAPWAPAAAAVHAGATAPALPDLRLQFMAEQAALNQALLMKLIEGLASGANRAPATDPAAMLTAVVTAFSVLKGASTEGGGSNLKQLRDVMEIVREAQELNPKGAAGEENMYTVLKDLGNKFLGPGSGPPAGRPSPVQTVHAGTSFRVTPLNPAEAAAQQQSQQPGPGPADPPTVVQWIQAGLSYLKEKAKLGKPVDLYKDLIWDHQEEPQFAALIQGITQGATFENLLQFDQEIAQTPHLLAWFQELYIDVHKEIFEHVDSAGPGGNGDNPGRNETPGTGGQPKPGGTLPGESGR